MKKILLVDDDPSMRFMLRLILEAAGYEVTEAHHGAAALRHLKEDSLPDLVVTDMMMPVMDGRELILHLRSDPRTARLRILVVSGNPDAREVGRNADAVMGKPFLPAVFRATVESLLAAGRVDATV